MRALTLTAAMFSLLVLAPALSAQERAKKKGGKKNAAQKEAGFKPIFNGQDLSGWKGNRELWAGEDG